MSNETQVSGKLPYEVPTLTVAGTLEGITGQDVDGSHFDMSFNAGDPIPPNFAS
jgi:hypothetical protein